VKTTYIYGLIDPRDNQVKYVGKSNNPKTRLLSHRRWWFDRHNPKGQWIKELKEHGLNPSCTILAEVPMPEWETHEQLWISKMIAAGSPLLNSVAGGLHGERIRKQKNRRRMK
jgi:hypothetical protein